MRKFLSFPVACLCCILFLTGTSSAAEMTNPILNKLVEKGVLSKEEALSVLQEMDREAVKTDENITESKSAESKDIEKVVNALKGFNFGLLWYLSYQNGQENNGTNFSRFAIKRGYLTVQKEFVPWFSARMTLDTTQVKDEAKDSNNKTFSNYDGSVAVRIKYAYGQFNLPDLSFLTKPVIEVGVVHMPWLDYEEHVNFYRCQDTMFIERNNTLNSADIGVTVASLLGGTIDEKYQNEVNKYYPGRYGSMSLGIYNGAGYHAAEKNENKVLEGRLTIRPLPDIVPGLQFSYFGLTGKGNKDTKPDWTANLGFASFEHQYVTLTGQYYRGKGNQKGDDENRKDGYSFFTEIKPMKQFSVIGRYDRFDPNTDAKNDENNRYIVGAAYHLDKPHKNMIVLDYDTVNYKQSDRKDDKRIQITLQVAL